MRTTILRLLLPLAALLGPGLAGSTQGVGKEEIVVGTIQDLSGPLAAVGKAVRQGMQLRVEEANEQGGIHGRRLRLVVEDSGYDPKRAVLAAQKLVDQDRIFVMAGHVGAAHNNAAMPVQFEKQVINFMPVTAARDMYEPLHRLKYSFSVTFYDQVRTWLPRMVRDKGVKKVCAIYQDDEFGLEVLRGAEAGLKAQNLELVERSAFKRGATDFSSQVARSRAAGCELVVLGTILRETIGTIGEARKTGWNPVFLGTNAAYSELIPRLGGKVVDGLYATMATQIPYLDEASQPLRFWATKYKTRFGDDPSVFSAYGYLIMDYFVQAATRAGPGLNTDSFIKAMDSSKFPADIFGSAPASFSATKRLGSDASRLSRIVDGRWKVVADYVTP